MIGWAPRKRNAFGVEQMAGPAGTFNAGVLAVGPAGRPFLEWWNARTSRYCLLEPGRALFSEQGWLASLPPVRLRGLREPGWNVNGYHLADQDVEWEDGSPRVGGVPVRCFHFLTFDPLAARPSSARLSPTSPRVWPSTAERPGAARLCREYAERVLAAGHEAAQAEQGPLERLADGTAVDANMRAAYLEALLEHEAGGGEAPPNPFDDGDADGFLRWLDEPWDGQDEAFPASRATWSACTRAWTGCTARSRRSPAPTPSASSGGCPKPSSAATSISPSVGCLHRRRRVRTPAWWSSRTTTATSWPRSRRSASSLSWRVTAPLRRAAALARRRH